jgi:hypothetical protein
MALIEVNKIINTVILWIEAERVVYETIIGQYFTNGRTLNIFKGRRKTIPASSLPSIEVIPAGDSAEWAFCRVQQDNIKLEFDLTIDNANPEVSVEVESKFVTLTQRILCSPPHLRAPIEGTQFHLQDSLATSVSYGSAKGGQQRVATISWEGKVLEYLDDSQFQPEYQGNGVWAS